jgi:hypothetical protein
LFTVAQRTARLALPSPVARTADQQAWIGIPLLWGMTALSMVIDYRANAPDPMRTGSWGRSLAALLVLIPWLLFSALMAIHADGVIRIDLVWVAVLAAIALVATIWSGMAAKRAATANNVSP